MGFAETTLQEHVNAEHPDSTAEVVCPICAAQPGGDPNLVTEDFAGHLALEHRPTPTPRDLISFLDEPTGTRHTVRRLPHSTRGIGSTRPRRSNMHFRQVYTHNFTHCMNVTIEHWSLSATAERDKILVT